MAVLKLRPTKGERVYYLTTDEQNVRIRRVSKSKQSHEVSIDVDDVPALINALADITEQGNT